jgi:DUF1365 family protein
LVTDRAVNSGTGCPARWTSGLYAGIVTHRRLGGPAHRFGYPIYMFLLDLDELDRLDGTLRLWGRNRRRVTSFRDSDHFRDGSRTVLDNLRAAVEGEGHEWPGGQVLLLTHCRVIGYVFNPVSFYYCFDRDGRLGVVVAEVNNTFGDRHAYVLPAADALPPGPTGGVVPSRFAWKEKKVMHVSPFFPLDGSYLWQFSLPGERLDVRIDVTVRGERTFTAALALTRQELSDAAIARALVRYPLVTAKVIGAIHWEALKLWWKGAPFHPQPAYDPEAARRGVS